MSSEKKHIIGEIELVVEDQRGKVKQRVTKTNTISDAFARSGFYDLFNTGTPQQALFRSNIRTNFNFVDRAVPTKLGIYCLNKSVNITAQSYRPPYVDESFLATKDVTFYNLGGNATETALTMIPMDTRCYFDQTKNQFSVEYIKNTGVGTVNAVVIGRDHTLLELYNVAIRDNMLLPEMFAATANYLLEYTGDSTILWRTNAAATTSTVYSFNFKTKESTSLAVAAAAGNSVNITNYFGGVIVNNGIYKVAKTSASAGQQVVTLTYVPDWKTNVTASTKVISFPTRAVGPLDIVSTPVIVPRPERNEIEIFTTVSIGEHGSENGGYGCNIQKAIVNLFNMTHTIEDLGIYRYGISNHTTSAALGYYKTGLYYEGKYWLPFWQIAMNNATLPFAGAAIQHGVITSDFQTTERQVNFQSAAAVTNVPVITDTGVKMLRASVAASPYVYISQIISGANLPEPVIKTEYDLLRVIYRYTLV